MKGKQHDDSNSIPPEALAYAFGHTEAWLEAYARSHQLPEYELRGGVAGLLLNTTFGQTSGAQHHLPALPSRTSKARRSVGKMAVDELSHRKTLRKSSHRQLSAAARKRISRAQKLRWKKYHERGGRGMKLAA